MSEEIRSESTRIWVWRCPQCGRELQYQSLEGAAAVRAEGACSECQYQRGRKLAKKRWLQEYRWLFGAKVVKARDHDRDEIDELLLLGTDGRYYVLSAGGYEERYIESREVSEKRAKTQRWG